ncbi:ribonuclease P protein component [Hydrogenimonas urashimensis]|uniref:ribonuclease P protein component n=1 Tax=Hydrogenimonas urashimensis TaxID=2740515 RepID=UPI001914F6FC|nr:ribonuclease P protein component [Hydrogenimonas urashimensis]
MHFESLKRSADFNRVYKTDKRWHDRAFVLFAVPNAKGCRVGFVASKKIGNAVKRARAKRRLRALFLKMAPLLKNGEYVMVAKPPVLDTPFSELEKAFRRAIKRLEIGQ